MTKRLLTITALMLALFITCSAGAETAVDVIMNTGTAQSFTDEAVSVEDLKTIMRAGLSAASAINQQPWFFAAVTNSDLMKELAGSGMGGGFSAPAGMPEGAGAPPQGDGASFPGGAPSGGSFPAAPAGGGAGSAKASLGDSPAAIIIYKDVNTKSPNADLDCGLAAQNMVIAASALGYGVKIVTSPTMSLNGENHDALCEKLGVDPSLEAVAVLLIGRTETADASTSASTRETLETRTVIVE